MPSTPFRVPGPLTVNFGGAGLGNTKSGAIIRTRTTWTPVTDDRHGAEPANFIFSGKSATVDILGLDADSLKAAGVWGATGGLLSSNENMEVGLLASGIGFNLELVEKGGTWHADVAVVTDPDELTLNSTTELRIPVRFVIVPDANDKLFSSLPSYIAV